MPRLFDVARKQLERQYVDVKFDPASGLSKEELVAEFERHRAENPDEPRIMTRAWLFHLLCSQGRIAVEPDGGSVLLVTNHSAEAIIVAAAKGEIPRVTIDYGSADGEEAKAGALI